MAKLTDEEILKEMQEVFFFSLNEREKIISLVAYKLGYNAKTKEYEKAIVEIQSSLTTSYDCGKKINETPQS